MIFRTANQCAVAMTEDFDNQFNKGGFILAYESRISASTHLALFLSTGAGPAHHGKSLHLVEET